MAPIIVDMGGAGWLGGVSQPIGVESRYGSCPIPIQVSEYDFGFIVFSDVSSWGSGYAGSLITSPPEVSFPSGWFGLLDIFSSLLLHADVWAAHPLLGPGLPVAMSLHPGQPSVKPYFSKS